MSFPRYSDYLASGLNWLGDVPCHWDIRRLGYYFGERREKVSDRDYQPLSVTKDGIVPQLETAAKTDDGDNRKRVCKGDFVINSRSDRKGSAGLSELDGSVSLISTVLKPKESVHGSFVHHLLRSVSFQEEFYRFGKGIVADLWSTNYTAMSGITLAMPPFSEQVAIATFLDHETAKIDALIAEQQRLIELLQEKRQAVISHAVTKGLNPDAPIKDSGVDWLGEVPEHWEITKLGWISTSKCDGPFGSGLKSDHYVEEGVRVVRLQNIKSSGFDDGSAAFIDPDYYSRALGDHDVLEADLLVAGLGDDKNLVGRSCVAPASILPAMVKADCFRFRLNRDVALQDFIAFSLNTSARVHGQTLSAGTTRSRIPLSVMAHRELALPPLEEQQKIEGFLRSELETFSALRIQAEEALTLLSERRSALISAAVTGQIDVRGLVPLESRA